MQKKLLIVAALGVLLLAGNPATQGATESMGAEAEPLPIRVSASDSRIRYIGRFDRSDAQGPRCSWSASAVALRFTGTALNVRLQDSGNSNLYEVIVDGKKTETLKLVGGSHLYRVFTGTGSDTHTVVLVKRTEGFFGTTQFQGFELSADGRMLPPPARPQRRIEVIGDSISCGYGNEAKSEKDHFSADTENAYLTYGAIAARVLGAEYICIAWSGRKMWPNNTMAEVYGRSLAVDENSRWDFSLWTPDVVIVTLGTNDFAGGAPDKPGWIAGYRAFLARVRNSYPKAAIYCATSPMMWGTPRTTMQTYLDQILRQERDAGHKVSLLDFTTQDGAKNGFGADWHPSVKTQQNMANQLSAVLQRDLGWKPLPILSEPQSPSQKQ